MTLANTHPRLLLAATLLCTFSVLGAIGYHASPSPAAAAYMPPATQEEIDTVLAQSRRSAASRGESRPAGRASSAPAAAALPAAVPAAGAAAPVAEAAAVAVPAATPYTLNTTGPGLLPTAAPGDFVNAESEPVETIAAQPAPDADDAPSRGFRTAGIRRPGSSSRR